MTTRVTEPAGPSSTAISRTEPAPRIGTGPRWLLPALLSTGLVVLLGCLVASGTATTTALPGLPDAGAGTRWALPVASFVAETAMVLALGAAVLVTALLPRADTMAVAVTARRALTTAGALSGLGALAGLMTFILTVSDLTAGPLPAALSAANLLAVASFWPGKLLLIGAGLSAVGAVIALRAAHRSAGSPGSRRVAVLLSGVLAAALIPWALGGHTTQAGQDIAASSLIVHVLAAGAWLGGLAIMVLHVRGDLLTVVLPRFSTLALWCWVSIGVSGVITGWLRVGQVSDLWSSDYGRLLLLKVLCLGMLGAFGAWHRRRIAAGLRTLSIGHRAALLRVAAIEVLVMGATMGVATALSATPPPVGHATGHESAHGTSRIEAMAGHRVPVLSAENLVLLWRPDVLVLLLVAVGVAGYLAGSRRMRTAAGGPVPRMRLWWAGAAAVGTVLTLNSGIATYDGVVWSVTVTQQAMTSMVIPFLIAMARPWELVAAETRIGLFFARVLSRPWCMLAGYAGWTALCLLTPVARWSAEYHGVLMAVRIIDIAVGTALFACLLPSPPRTETGTGRGVSPSPTALLMAWFAVEAVVSAALLFGGGAAARPWFTELNLAWITVGQDERAAAVAHLGIAIVILLLVTALPAKPGPKD